MSLRSTSSEKAMGSYVLNEGTTIKKGNRCHDGRGGVEGTQFDHHVQHAFGSEMFHLFPTYIQSK